MTSRGVRVGGPYAELATLGREVESRGFDAVWVSESTQAATVQAAVLAQATERVQVATNITLAFPRSPTVTAMEAWDLNELSGDRFVVGLGSQVKRIIEERFSADFDRPAKRMAEYVQAMQTVWRMERGEDVTFDGEIYRVLRPGLGGRGKVTDRDPPRTYVAAVGPLMTKAAASYADGILGHPFTSDRYLTDDVLPRIDEALAEAGRDRSGFTVAQGVILCIADDREVAVREAKQQIASTARPRTTRGCSPPTATRSSRVASGRLSRRAARIRERWRRPCPTRRSSATPWPAPPTRSRTSWPTSNATSTTSSSAARGSAWHPVGWRRTCRRSWRSVHRAEREQAVPRHPYRPVGMVRGEREDR